MLSYGRMIDSKGLMERADCSNWSTVPEIVPGISSRRFAASLGDCVTDNIPTSLMTSEKTLSAFHHNEKARTNCNMLTRSLLLSLSGCSSYTEENLDNFIEATSKNAQDLKSCEGFPREGSSPSSGTLLTRVSAKLSLLDSS